MGDTLEIFGKEYTNVAGFKAKDGSGNTLTYTRGGGGGGASEFVITLTKNSNNLWETNKTFAEITTAYSAGNILRVAAQNPGSGSDFSCETYCDYDNTGSTPNFNYQITWFDYDDDIDNGDFFEDWYTLNANGLTLSDRQVYEPPRTLVSKTITANGTYNPILTDSADGYSSVTVNVPVGEIYTATITTAGTSADSYVLYNETKYYSLNSTFTFSAGDTCTIHGEGARVNGRVYENNVLIADGVLNYVYTLPNGSICIDLDSDSMSGSYADVYIFTPTIPRGTLGVTTNGVVVVRDYNEIDVNVPSGSPNLQAKTNVSPSTSSQTITADSGYDGLSSVQINAMPSGTAGTPTATKGTVSNHAVTVTPSVTNTTGYITGGTKTGTAVTVSASELVSGSETKTSNDTYDVTNLAELVVNVPTGTARSSSDLTVSGATVTVPAGLYSTQATKSVASGSTGTPTATKGTVSNHSITVTPSVTNTTGYITGGTKSGTGVTVSASELVSGSQTITANGTVNVTNLASVNVAISYSTITVSSSNPSGGNNGDIWIKR